LVTFPSNLRKGAEAFVLISVEEAAKVESAELGSAVEEGIVPSDETVGLAGKEGSGVLENASRVGD
jgi:hypothetical protein